MPMWVLAQQQPVTVAQDDSERTLQSGTVVVSSKRNPVASLPSSTVILGGD
ncbi:hypothetical protein [Aquincola tertiaricarbonis]|uniref:hypothetical protein n=1 Tax=Aquincola tertiaricarbonis TaxID=391953 RepID=UPI001E2E44D4|nr:hypothetical protein [Aquincola tertiaricarbonis]